MVFSFFKIKDLAGLIESNISFSEAQTKSLMKQLLEGVVYFHNFCIIHRDIKSKNN
jgi:serine/threonine protein kinase